MAIQQINLINPLFKKKTVYFSAAMILKATMLSITAGLAVVIFLNHQLGEIKSALTLEKKALSMAELELDKARLASMLLTKNNALQENLRDAEAHAASLKKIKAVLNQSEINNTTGYSAILQALARQIGSGIWLTGLTIAHAGTDVSLQGKTLSPELIPAYLNRLKQESAFSELQFSVLEMHLPESTGIKKSEAPLSTLPSVLEFKLQSVAVVPPVVDVIRPEVAR
ncbi:PilN domain-containing protein [Actimicrobium sp. CCC2.4]|uniref:PilN domain-containing protein n=1 Tax=Actimicrobium sp. CCC2.4 TaxID=3048606 RepID=UPI002AC8B2B2|nr:PilN domain-containing protein [Actimicrobium sp. CCC2.4]MEB0134705.1 PilN domain-containing protein [Actimicrobium sp. CCC2.4]WPX30648.1 PilN domain-containing protein [Actimicrobium sp. CCC2.4]